MFSASTTLQTITSTFGLQGTCLFIIIISTLFLAIPLLYNRNKIFENFKPCLGEVPPETIPVSGSSKSSIPRVSESSNEVFKDKDEGSIPESVCSEIVDPSSATDLDTPSSPGGPASVDSNLVNYCSYRHKLIEETLQKQYGGGYAPGNVILNLIELNTVDSGASDILDKKYDRSFFDLVKIREDIETVCNRVEYPDQLNHFIPRNLKKRSTTEIHTEISEVNVATPTRPNTPTSCQRIILKRSREAGGLLKSPFLTPVQSRAPINEETIRPDTPGTAKEIRLLEAPLTEQLYRRNEARPDVVSKTHVEAEAEYLNRIAKNMRFEMMMNQTGQGRPRIRSSLKKTRPKEKAEMSSFDQNGRRVFHDKTGDCNRLRRSAVRNDLRNLSALKPTVWNN